MKKINTDDLRRHLDDGPLALFDVRGDVLFEQGHIPGAKTAPLGSLTFRVARLMNPDSLVVVYSDGEGCDLANQAASRLADLGMTNVHCYEEGLAGWSAADQPVEESIKAKLVTQGEVQECRPLVVDLENSYGGAFKGTKGHTEMAGG